MTIIGGPEAGDREQEKSDSPYKIPYIYTKCYIT